MPNNLKVKTLLRGTAMAATTMFLLLMMGCGFWQMRPATVLHNSPQTVSKVRRLVGDELPVEETWYTQVPVFTGHGPEFIRVRFSAGKRDEVRRLLRSRCRTGGRALPQEPPESSSMPWDAPKDPIEPYTCGESFGDYFLDFGTSGDTVLLYDPGH